MVTVVSLYVCVSVTALTATYLVFKSEVRILYGVLQICNVAFH